MSVESSTVVDAPGGAGRRITVLVTRPSERGKHLADCFEAAGFRAEVFPLIEIGPPSDPEPLMVAAARAVAGGYDWIAFTSANGARALAGALARLPAGPGGKPLAPDVDTAIAVVGPATAGEVEAQGWQVHLVAGVHTAEGLLDALSHAVPQREARILIPQAEAARDVLHSGLRSLGAQVDVVIAYRTAPVGGARLEALRRLLREGQVDLVTFASPSAVEAFDEALGEEGRGVPAAAIGPVTASAAERLGFHVVVVAEHHTAEGLVAAVSRWAESEALG